MAALSRSEIVSVCSSSSSCEASLSPTKKMIIFQSQSEKKRLHPPTRLPWSNHSPNRRRFRIGGLYGQTESLPVSVINRLFRTLGRLVSLPNHEHDRVRDKVAWSQTTWWLACGANNPQLFFDLQSQTPSRADIIRGHPWLSVWIAHLHTCGPALMILFTPYLRVLTIFILGLLTGFLLFNCLTKLFRHLPEHLFPLFSSCCFSYNNKVNTQLANLNKMAVVLPTWYARRIGLWSAF